MATSRYNKFKVNGKMRRLPLVQLTKKESDYFETYKKNVTMLDGLSYKYYNDPNYVWVIMMANQEYGSMEYDIPDGAVLRIPFPLDVTIVDYNDKIQKLMTKYNFN